MNADKLVIGLTGMPGSGKSLVVKAAQELGYDVVTMGDVVREETAKHGLEPTPANVGKVMLELRKTNGDRVIAEKCIPKIEEKQSKRIIIDGLRSYIEADTFQNLLANFVLVTVHSPPQIRFQRLSTRGRSDDPKTYEVFHERDMRELGVGIGYAIALAEYVIVNDGSKEVLNARVVETLRSVEAKWNKQ
jgi:dephospho-CoA kinase